MPHYTDGTLAKPGDIVRGKGYNIKDENGELVEIVGVAVSITENHPTCNITVLLPDESLGYFTAFGQNGGGNLQKPGYVLAGRVEYGQTDHFEKIV